MKTNYYIGAALVLGALSLCTSCDNYFDEKYMDNGDPQISVVETHDYTLTADDYKTIANNSVNKAYAAMLDSVNETDINVPALAAVGENCYFNDIASADMYVPAFIYNKYPQMDPGSTFNVTYNTFEGTPKYLDFYNNTIQYELTGSNYNTIWGNWDTPYLTPSTEAKLIQFLPEVEDDWLVGVKYAYSSKEPADGGKAETVKEVIYIYKDGYMWQPYDFAGEPAVRLLPAEAVGQEAKWLALNFPLAKEDQTVALMVYSKDLKHYITTEYKFDGEVWTANLGVIEETLSFVLSEGWAANLSTYYRQAIAGDGDQGKIVTQHINLEEGITFIWAFNNSYGMKGSAYYSGPHYGEGWFVTPKIKLKNSTAPALSFDHAVNYGPTDETRGEQLTVWVSTDYVDDVTTATWTQLPWNEWNGETGLPDANSWTFYNSGRMDLSKWNNETIFIGFRYKSEPGQTCSTWEVKNILVNEPEEEESEE